MTASGFFDKVMTVCVEENVQSGNAHTGKLLREELSLLRFRRMIYAGKPVFLDKGD